MKKWLTAFSELTKFELCLWIVSLSAVIGSFLLFQSKDYTTLIASVIGVTALIFLARGHALGQILIIAFAVFYGTVSFFFHYYGEMITYLGMSAPTAVVALISWIRHPYKNTSQVAIARLTRRSLLLMAGLAAVTTVGFYFILKALDNANLIASTVSVTTSFIAAYLSAARSPYYALGYAANDVVLIVLWAMAAAEDLSYAPMVVCFVTFLFNDLYGFISWHKREREQNAE